MNKKADSVALSSVLLAKFDTGVYETEAAIQKELSNSNHVFYSLTYSNDVLNAHVRQLEHKRNVLQRKYIIELLKHNPPNINPEQKEKLMKILDFINQKIKYDYLMAVKTKNELEERISDLSQK